MIRLKNVSKYYHKDGVITSGFTKLNLELYLGEFVVITGESGSGKSTLLNVISGLDSYEDGELYINGEETSHYTEDDYLEYRRKYVSNIFQNFNLVNSYTVYENIELALLMNGKNRKNIKKYILELIDKVKLTKYKNTLVSKLSGGQKQRVAIARALANDTPIIVADEPTGSLDSKSSKEILKLLHEISKDKLVIVVTHNKTEIEEYATRLLRMHDGKLLEDKIINKINLDDNLEEKETKNITKLNKLVLGFRNAFNIPIKFILMFIIFLLITITLITNYGAFQMSEYESTGLGYNDYFMNDSDYRVVLTKKDKTTFNENDYNKILKLENIDNLEKNDLLIDYNIGIYNNEFYFYGTINTSKISSVDLGRLPQNEKEIVIKGSKNNWYISNISEDIFNEKFTIDGFNGNKYNNTIKVVGIIYDEDENYYNDYLEFYLSNEILNDITFSVNERYSEVKYILNGTYLNGYDTPYVEIKVNDNVLNGEVYVSEGLSYYCKNYNCINNTLKIKTSNIFINDENEYKISKVYNNDNSKNILGINYEDAEGYIYINRYEYNRLFNKGNYQSSIFVKELKDLDNTVNELENLGFDTLKIKDAKYNDGESILQIVKIFKLVVTIGLIITLFFISYFIIKIIYKSRNSYYTTLRTLGSTKNVCINILRNELFTISTFTYTLFLLFIILVNKGIINFEYFKVITKYIEIIDYVIVYFILILLSVLISNRYGRKIFKNSIIKTYGEKI